MQVPAQEEHTPLSPEAPSSRLVPDSVPELPPELPPEPEPLPEPEAPLDEEASFVPASPFSVPLFDPELPQPAEKPIATVTVLIAQTARCALLDEAIPSAPPVQRTPKRRARQLALAFGSLLPTRAGAIVPT
jgi:hypothetical protein